MPHVPDNQKYRGKHGTTVQPLNTWYKAGGGNTEAPIRIGAAPGTRPNVRWESLTTIYYRTTDDNDLDTYILNGANDLKAQIERVRPDPPMSIVTVNPDGVAIRLYKDASAFGSTLPDDSYKLLVDALGVTITGKTAIAVRHGVYAFLHEIGYRWFSMNPKWHVVPASLTIPTLPGQVVSPDYDNREIVAQAGPLQDVTTGQADHRQYRERNLAPSNKEYLGEHSYRKIWKEEEAAVSHPDSVCYAPDTGLLSTLEPTDAEVLNRAKAYADNRLTNFAIQNKRHAMVCSISPKDGFPKCPSWFDPNRAQKTDYQVMSDSILWLTNEVAKYIATRYPGKLAGVLSYSGYFLPPASFTMEPNTFVSITTGIGIAAAPAFIPSLTARIQGYAPAKVAMYDYWHVWQYTHDRTFAPGKFAELLATMQEAQAAGAFGYRCETGLNFGAKILHYWRFSRLLWDLDANVDALTTDFCTHAYGPAAATMKVWHDRWDTVTTPETTMEQKHAAGFPDLQTALDSVPANGPIAARIRQIILWAYYDWRWGAAIKTGNVVYNMTQAEMEAWYRFVWRVTAEQIITTQYEKNRGATELKTKFPATYPDDASLVPLQSLTPYTATEVRTFLDEALAAT